MITGNDRIAPITSIVLHNDTGSGEVSSGVCDDSRIRIALKSIAVAEHL